jgi:hypothetical protein
VPVTEAALVAACSGKPVPGTAPYGGTTGHPLVVVNTAKKALYAGLGANSNWTTGVWTGDMIQLVVCVPPSKSVQTADCGKYWGPYGLGEVLLLKRTILVTAIRTDTGAKVTSKTLAGYTMKCASTLDPSGVATKPPYKIYGGEPTGAQINSYATSLSS